MSVNGTNAIKGLGKEVRVVIFSFAVYYEIMKFTLLGKGGGGVMCIIMVGKVAMILAGKGKVLIDNLKVHYSINTV